MKPFGTDGKDYVVVLKEVLLKDNRDLKNMDSWRILTEGGFVAKFKWIKYPNFFKDGCTPSSAQDSEDDDAFLMVIFPSEVCSSENQEDHIAFAKEIFERASREYRDSPTV